MDLPQRLAREKHLMALSHLAEKNLPTWHGGGFISLSCPPHHLVRGTKGQSMAIILSPLGSCGCSRGSSTFLLWTKPWLHCSCYSVTSPVTFVAYCRYMDGCVLRIYWRVWRLLWILHVTRLTALSPIYDHKMLRLDLRLASTSSVVTLAPPTPSLYHRRQPVARGWWN